jgi:phage repressor protein C with HTH and peptisase S24 domain
MTFAERLAQLHPIKTDDDKKALAAKIGVSFRTVQRWVNENALPKGDYLMSIKASFPGISVDWLLSGEGEPFKKDKTEEYRTADQEGLWGRTEQAKVEGKGFTVTTYDAKDSQAVPAAVAIPEPGAFDPSYFDFVPMAEAYLSGGGGAFVLSEKFKEFYAFRKEWIRRVATSPKSVVLMPVRGTSMHPTIQDGDVVMLDTGRARVFDGQIYALSLNDTIMIKRLENIVGGRIRIISENRLEFPPYEADARSVRIIGQVIWFARELVSRE